MAEEHRRTVVRDFYFDLSLHRLIHDAGAAEKYIAGAIQALSEDASLGMTFGEEIWVLPMAPIRGMEVWLYYICYEEVVVLLDLASEWD